MASIRRSLSPILRIRALLNRQPCSVPALLSKSSSCKDNSDPQSGGLMLSSLFGKAYSQAFFVLSVFSTRRSCTIPKGKVWRALFHFFICFTVGFFFGIAPFVSTSSSRMKPKHQALSLDVKSTPENAHIDHNHTKLPVRVDFNITLDVPVNKMESRVEMPKLLIIVTPTYNRPFQAHYLNRLAHTLKLVPRPLLWIVVEVISESEETADVILMRTGLLYRHLVCRKKLNGIKNRSLVQRNVALSHIERHRLDGIVYFADENNVYLTKLFEHMRDIRRFGTWPVAQRIGDKSEAIWDGPVCNGTEVIGWHLNGSSRRFKTYRRFHTDMSGFAFNSTILWDPKRWHRPTLKPIRLRDSVEHGFQVSAFIEQLVEDESQMECLLPNCSTIMVWR